MLYHKLLRDICNVELAKRGSTAELDIMDRRCQYKRCTVRVLKWLLICAYACFMLHERYYILTKPWETLTFILLFTLFGVLVDLDRSFDISDTLKIVKGDGFIIQDLINSQTGKYVTAEGKGTDDINKARRFSTKESAQLELEKLIDPDHFNIVEIVIIRKTKGAKDVK